MTVSAGMTTAQATAEISRLLSEAGIDEPRLDARILIEAATGESRERLFLDRERQLTPAEAQRLNQSLARRLKREPVTRILGERHFYGRRFTVTGATLDPRPDTEALIELALSIAQEEDWQSRPVRILDVGTGTGCILLTLLAELPLATGVGTDLSAAALDVARHNAARLGLSDRAEWHVRRTLEDGHPNAPYDLIVSNPPYIPSATIPELDPEVRDFDPLLALDGGLDGLDVIRDIVEASSDAERHLARWFAIEFGAGQYEAAVDLIRASCGDEVAQAHRFRNDLGGHTRCVAWLPRH